MRRLISTSFGDRVRRYLLPIPVGVAALITGLIIAGPLFAETSPSTIAASPKPVVVLTHHYDAQRTGWNRAETVLTTANVNSTSFGLLQTIRVDDQIDAQPLVLYAPTHDNAPVVFVATESNTIYVIQPVLGKVLLTRNLGPPVPRSMLPGGCQNGGPNLGINSTPVVDLQRRTLYVIAYTLENGAPVYRLHALKLIDLSDRVPPVLVSASHTLADGTTYSFRADVTRQRPALLEANGNIYAGFGSFCDLRANVSRGWVLGWNADTLASLPANQLNDELGKSASNYFLSVIWMSGAGIAADEAGNLFFATSNSDSKTYDPPSNIQESVVQMSGDLTTILGLFTPSNQATLDANDMDLGAGGVLVIPQQPSLPIPNLAAAAGKDGNLYLLNRDAFAGFTSPGKALRTSLIGACWCAESYFEGPDGVGRIVSSLGVNAIVFKLQASGSGVTLVTDSISPQLNTGQDPGFFTTVSSNGTQPGTAIIWAVSRPVNTNPANVTLYAFNAATGARLYSAHAGAWPGPQSNANIVPVVANGLVYVASYQQLTVFGLGGAKPNATLASAEASATAEQGSRVSGRVKSIDGSIVMLQTRTGLVEVDALQAQNNHLSVVPVVGNALMVRGTYDAAGVLHAQTILRAKSSPALWEPDR